MSRNKCTIAGTHDRKYVTLITLPQGVPAWCVRPTAASHSNASPPQTCGLKLITCMPRLVLANPKLSSTHAPQHTQLLALRFYFRNECYNKPPLCVTFGVWQRHGPLPASETLPIIWSPCLNRGMPPILYIYQTHCCMKAYIPPTLTTAPLH